MITRWYRRLRRRGGRDAWLDEFLDGADHEILAALDSLDLEAGLAAIIGEPATESPASPGQGGLVAEICQTLTRLISMIAPAPGGLGSVRSSTFNLQTAAAMLAELESRLAGRAIDRDAAFRLLRLAQHNLIEAVPLLLAESSARRRTAASAEAKRQLGLAKDAAEQINELYPQVSALFDDAGDLAAAPVPYVPR